MGIGRGRQDMRFKGSNPRPSQKQNRYCIWKLHADPLIYTFIDWFSVSLLLLWWRGSHTWLWYLHMLVCGVCAEDHPVTLGHKWLCQGIVQSMWNRTNVGLISVASSLQFKYSSTLTWGISVSLSYLEWYYYEEHFTFWYAHR